MVCISKELFSSYWPPNTLKSTSHIPPITCSVRSSTKTSHLEESIWKYVCTDEVKMFCSLAAVSKVDQRKNGSSVVMNRHFAICWPLGRKNSALVVWQPVARTGGRMNFQWISVDSVCKCPAVSQQSEAGFFSTTMIHSRPQNPTWTTSTTTSWGSERVCGEELLNK